MDTWSSFSWFAPTRGLGSSTAKAVLCSENLDNHPPIHLHRQLAANLAWWNLKAGSGRLLGEGRQAMSGLRLLHARPRQLDGLDQMWSWNNLTYASGGGGTEWRRLAPQACDGGRSNQVTGTSPKLTRIPAASRTMTFKPSSGRRIDFLALADGM